MPNCNREKTFSNKEIYSAAIQAFFGIADEWELSTAEGQNLLGLNPNSSSYFVWKKKGNGILSKDQLDRVSYLLGIYKALKIIFSDDKQANDWVRKPNKAFNGKSVLEVMLQGKITDLATVRSYLDAQRGW